MKPDTDPVHPIVERIARAMARSYAIGWNETPTNHPRFAVAAWVDTNWKMFLTEASECLPVQDPIPAKALEDIPCPDCYGGHFRPCQMCGDTGRVKPLPASLSKEEIHFLKLAELTLQSRARFLAAHFHGLKDCETFEKRFENLKKAAIEYGRAVHLGLISPPKK